MDRLQVAEFRAGFRELSRPAEVIRYNKLVGTWYPAGFSLAPVETADDYTAAGEDLVEEVKQLKRQLAARGDSVVVHKPASNVRADQGFNSRPFTPVPKVKK